MEPGEPVKVFVTAPPADNEANKAVVEALSRALGVPKSRLTIVRGQTSREKLVDVQGVTDAELTVRLASLKS